MGRSNECSDRSQLCILSERLEDRVHEDHPIHFIETLSAFWILERSTSLARCSPRQIKSRDSSRSQGPSRMQRTAERRRGPWLLVRARRISCHGYPPSFGGGCGKEQRAVDPHRARGPLAGLPASEVVSKGVAGALLALAVLAHLLERHGRACISLLDRSVDVRDGRSRNYRQPSASCDEHDGNAFLHCFCLFLDSAPCRCMPSLGRR